MAITQTALEILKQLIDGIPTRPVSMLMAGYQDVLVPPAKMTAMFGPKIFENAVYREDSKSILKWHSLEHVMSDVFETKTFFQRIGVDLTIIDIAKIRGDEEIHDLNFPISDSLRNRFDIVHDGGTMEHCFNVGQTIVNYLAMAKVGGFVIHSNPFTMVNHGFYNFCPTFYADFYGDNGHRLAGPIYCVYEVGTKVFRLEPFRRVQGDLPKNAEIIAIAQKVVDKPPVWPMQTKYKNNSGKT